MTMRALVVHGPHDARVDDVPVPEPAVGELLVRVDRAGICGTDVELFTGEMAYYARGRTHHPLRLGHEWTGTVVATGSASEGLWVGRRVIGDTMLGCGACADCRGGRQHVCADRREVGITDGWPGMLAEYAADPHPVRPLRAGRGEHHRGRAGGAGGQRAARRAGRRRSIRGVGC